MAPLIKNNKSKFRDEASILQFILNELKTNNDGCSEVDLSRRYDPVLVKKILDTLVSRGVIILNVDANQSGGQRRIYKLGGQ